MQLLQPYNCNISLGKNNLTLVKGSVKEIPYHNNSFDMVLCNQTIEHWFEYNVSLKRALSEISRVLKPKGLLMINAPIHVHGDPRFLRGELDKIFNIFGKTEWDIVLFEIIFHKSTIQPLIRSNPPIGVIGPRKEKLAFHKLAVINR